MRTHFAKKRLFAIVLYDAFLPNICCCVFKDEVACDQAHPVIFGKFGVKNRARKSARRL